MSRKGEFTPFGGGDIPAPYSWYKSMGPLHNEHTIKTPALYQVVILHDDFTPPSFVLTLLVDMFHLDYDEAKALVMKWQRKESIICSLATRDIAETKMIDMIHTARAQHHPLRCVIRKEQNRA